MKERGLIPIVAGEILKTKKVVLLWLIGFKEACCFHRAFIFCRRSRLLLIRTGQCFLLNGLIFLGSLFFLNSLVIPSLMWILPDHCNQVGSQEFCDQATSLQLYSSLRNLLVQFFYIFWFYPLYVFSFILSSMWYTDIAKNAFAASMENHSSRKLELRDKNESTDSQDISRLERPAGLEGIILGIGEQIYSLLLLFFFFIQVFATGYIPWIGQTMNFFLLSWMYSYYCFEYKWNYSELSLDKRIKFFESNWPFFAGFGSPCVLAILFFPPLVSYGVMSILYPLFVLTAMGTHAEDVITLQRRSWSDLELVKLPIFYIADILSMKVLQLLPKELGKNQ
ncbi:hypothetical protein ZOSMA_37G01360 [Zostera marina]|uniref:Protein EI24 homolog n=1 Tax=Zostera marina TaxID=29655 RepID=A0A0K9P5E7_ZOSMR|nr:hypothetical protein ZOSMA_37G01360 [Zostera marina]